MASEVCTCSNDDNQIVVTVNQGEARGFRFTIEQDDNPMDLTEWQITVDVKNAPYSALDPMIRKVVTTTSDYNTQGQIIDPENGVFVVNYTEEELNLPPMDYAFVAEATDGYTTINLTHNGNYSAIFRVREQ